MTSSPADLQKVVFITGCSKGGIGFELCEAFADKGCRVYASARRVEAMEGFKHCGIRRITVDVLKEEDIKRAIEYIIAEEGKLDIVVSNAGALCIGPVIDITAKQAQECFDLNVLGTLRLARATVPHMASKKSGLFITVGSIAGSYPTPFNGVYCAAKAALHALTETLHMELSPFGIRTLLIIPASVKSNIAQNHTSIFQLPPNSLYKSYLDRIVGRMWISQKEGGTMDTDVFARQVVGKALKTDPPSYWLGGGLLMRWYLLSVLPRWLALRLIWKKIAGK